MRWRRLLWIFACAAAAAALACSGDAEQQQAQQSIASAAAPQQAGEQQAQQQQQAAADDTQVQQEEPQSQDAEEQSNRPAMRSDDDQQNVAYPQQQADPYGSDAEGPPAAIAEPREAIVDGIELAPSAPAAGDEYGWSAVVDGDIIAVGAPYHDDVAEDAGAVFIFERRGEQWVETAKLLPPFGEAEGWFGRWLALDDGRLVIGAPYEDLATSSGDDWIVDAGAAYVYEQVGGEWQRTATLLPESPTPGASFGWSVAIDEDRLAVSAWAETAGDELAGAVYVYRWQKGLWRLEARVEPPEPQPVHQFGRDIELEQNVLVIGAPGHDSDETDDVGAVFVYHQYNFTWNFTGAFVASDGGEGDALGSQVALSLPWFAAGAYGQDQDGWDAGAVYVWRLGDFWSLHSRVTASDWALGDWFGYAPALQGDRLVVGSPHRADPDTGLYRTGAAYLFELENDQWVERGVLGPVDPVLAGEQAEFGWVTDIDGDTIVVGSWLADTAAGEDAGAAAAYLLPQ